MDSAAVFPSKPFVLLLFGGLSGSMKKAIAGLLIRRGVYSLINLKALGRDDIDTARKLVEIWQPIFIPFLTKQRQFTAGQT